ncbi:hypothetical protein ACIBCM_00205 [Streptomyces sp. NPDC051018]|uniref:hypothetical protein n=1 Tax=Streptomyces sp. NPDC051018 TaxID=3365639 RepID=UPI00379CE75C
MSATTLLLLAARCQASPMLGMDRGTTRGTTTASARGRLRRLWAAIGVAGTVVAVVAGVAGCEPSADGLSSAAVAVTTDRTATRTLERVGFDVSWFSCTATLEGAGGSGSSASPSASPGGRAAATVDCEGETGSGQRITLKGTVTDERSGVCVRGRMTARVNGELAFEARYLGECGGESAGESGGGGGMPSRTERPGGRPEVTVTVTETVTVTPEK